MTDTTLRQLIALVKTGNPTERIRALSDIAGFASYSEEVVDAIVNALQDPDSDVRRQAVCELGYFMRPIPQAVPQLIKSLKDPIPHMRKAAADALRLMAPDSQEVVAALIDAMGDHEIVCEAIDGLAAIGPPATTAIPVLLDVMKNEELKGYAARALGRIGAEAKQSVPLIALLLQSPNITRRRTAAEALGHIGSAASDSIPLLMTAYHDYNFHEQARQCLIPRFENPAFLEFSRHPGHLQIDIALALWRISQHPMALPMLIHRLTDDFDTVRMRGIDVLRKIAPTDERVVTEFIRLTRDPIVFVRCHAVMAIAMSGTNFSSILPALIAVLADQHPGAQFQAAKTLGAFGSFAAPATAALEQLLHAPDELVRAVAAGALWRITRREEAMTSLIKMVEQLDSRSAASELGEIGPEARRAIPALLRMRNSPDLNIRHDALEALAQIAGVPQEN